VTLDTDGTTNLPVSGHASHDPYIPPRRPSPEAYPLPTAEELLRALGPDLANCPANRVYGHSPNSGRIGDATSRDAASFARYVISTMHFGGRGVPQDFVLMHKRLNLVATLPAARLTRKLSTRLATSALQKDGPGLDRERAEVGAPVEANAVDGGHQTQKKLDRQFSRLAGALFNSFPSRAWRILIECIEQAGAFAKAGYCVSAQANSANTRPAPQ
jgi:hypothetical protein